LIAVTQPNNNNEIYIALGIQTIRVAAAVDSLHIRLGGRP